MLKSFPVWASTLIFAAKLKTGMGKNIVKSLLVAAFSLFFMANIAVAQAHENEHQGTEHPATAGKLDPGKLIMEHISDNHDFHFFDWGTHPVSIPLPIILYSPQKGLSVFSSSRFEHGHAEYQGYKLNEGNKIESTEEGVEVYDFSMTKNVVQMLLALALLVIVMLNVAKKYKKNGSNVAPSGFQNAVEPVITFIRDEVGKPNLGKKYEKYMPLLLTVFFFILINNIFGLIPGTANVTGNIAFTVLLAAIALIIILASTNKHYWGHIFWPPGVPFLVKFILIPVELAGVFIKPVALAIRLFANMVAGHIVITCFIMLIFIFAEMSKGVGIGFAPVSIAFTVFIYFIEILVAFIQAFIFTNLMAVFIGQSMEGGDHAHEEIHI